MKAQYFHIPKTGDASFIVQHDLLPAFFGNLHYHPEIQITLIVKGTGRGILGDQILRFKPGTLVVIGADIPHVFKSDQKNDEGVEAISIYFDQKAFGEQFFNLPEVKHLGRFIELTGLVLEVQGVTRTFVEEKLWHLEENQGFTKFIWLLEILNRLSKSNELRVVSEIFSLAPVKDREAARLDRVFNFVLENYQTAIRLDQIAEMVHMSPTAFCRYFKARTRKPFFSFLLEVRLARAAQLLEDTDLKISLVAYEAGFNNISHFNREFRKLMSCTPQEYRLKLR